MREQLSQLELVTEGLVTISSGRMLIVDPCNTEELVFNLHARFSPKTEFDFPQSGQALDALEKMNVSTGKYLDQLNAGQKPDAAGMTPGRQLLNDYRRLTEEARAAAREYNEKNTLQPPKLVQGQCGVYLGTTYGDGVFAVTRTNSGFAVDLNRIGDYVRRRLGLVCVDSGTLAVLDAAPITVTKDAHRDAYCVLEVPNGVYRCAFRRKNNDLLTIQK